MLPFIVCYEIGRNQKGGRIFMGEPKKSRSVYTKMFKGYPDVLSVEQLCDVLGGISRRTVYKLLQENKIENIKVGREYRVAKINVIDFLIKIP